MALRVPCQGNRCVWVSCRPLMSRLFCSGLSQGHCALFLFVESTIEVLADKINNIGYFEKRKKSC
jgi:hypothetical protein